MVILKGTGVSQGIAIGKLSFRVQRTLKIEPTPIDDVEAEIIRFESARGTACVQLGKLAVETAAKLGEENSLLFQIHQMMLEDLDYHDAIVRRIEDNKYCAEYAVSETALEFELMFSEMEDEYMKARAVDVGDVSRRVIEVLQGISLDDSVMANPAILAGDDFTPSETALFDRDCVLGLVTKGGSKNSHTAIFARTLAIPTVIGLGDSLDEQYDDEMIIIDGETGEVIISPTEQQLATKIDKKRALEQKLLQLQEYKGKKTLTKAGREVKLFANIGTVEDVQTVLDNDAEGIGLFRSEFLYLENSDYPTEEQQFTAYKKVVEKMGDKPVIIRTLDIGADKQADYFKLPQEENPALGLRALRICLTRPEIFRTQLRALYRASVYGNLQVMLPMVTSLWEVQKSKELIAEVKAELDEQGIEYKQDVPVGIMIETPAAAVISDILAKEVDFFSVGTNDLIQYTLATDRQNESLEPFCDIHHQAVLRLIEMAAKNAHDNGIWIGICGELGADLDLYDFYDSIGIDELSVTPSAVLACREKLSMV